MRMSNESDFNSDLAKELKKYRPEVFTVKSSDKYTAGISDFLIWSNGKCAALEVKMLTRLVDFSKLQKALLIHPFSAGQTLFMRHIKETGNEAFGLVVYKPGQCMYLIDTMNINTAGNISTDIINNSACFSASDLGVEMLLRVLF